MAKIQQWKNYMACFPVYHIYNASSMGTFYLNSYIDQLPCPYDSTQTINVYHKLDFTRLPTMRVDGPRDSVCIPVSLSGIHLGTVDLKPTPFLGSEPIQTLVIPCYFPTICIHSATTLVPRREAFSSRRIAQMGLFQMGHCYPVKDGRKQGRIPCAEQNLLAILCTINAFWKTWYVCLPPNGIASKS